MAVRSPLVFCASVPSCLNLPLNLPFGLPILTFQDPCCKGIDLTLDQLNQLLAPLMPFLQLLDCVMKLVNIVMAIPDSLGPPPDVGKIVEIIGMVAQFFGVCVPLLLSFIPGNPIPFIKLVRDICNIIISVLQCLKRLLTVFIQIAADVLMLSTTTDPYLHNMGICLAQHNNSLGANIKDKLGGLLNIFVLINTLIGLIPPLAEVLEEAGYYPLAPIMGGNEPPASVEFLDVPINILIVVSTICNIAVGGS